MPVNPSTRPDRWNPLPGPDRRPPWRYARPRPRHQIAKTRVAVFQVVVTLLFRDIIGVTLVSRPCRHPDAAIVAQALAHQGQLALIGAMHQGIQVGWIWTKQGLAKPSPAQDTAPGPRLHCWPWHWWKGSTHCHSPQWPDRPHVLRNVQLAADHIAADNACGPPFCTTIPSSPDGRPWSPCQRRTWRIRALYAPKRELLDRVLARGA